MNQRIGALGLVFSIACVSACGGGSSTSGGGSSTSGGGGSTSGDGGSTSGVGGSTSTVECIEDSPCFEPSIVDPADSWCYGDAQPAAMGLIEDNSAKCVIEALRDGKKGRVRINRSPEGD